MHNGTNEKDAVIELFKAAVKSTLDTSPAAMEKVYFHYARYLDEVMNHAKQREAKQEKTAVRGSYEYIKTKTQRHELRHLADMHSGRNFQLRFRPKTPGGIRICSMANSTGRFGGRFRRACKIHIRKVRL